MPEIKKANIFGHSKIEKDRYGDYDEQEDRQYCQSCLRLGIRSKLMRRMYKVEKINEQGQGQEGKPKLVPATVPDADRFRQCYHCGDIVPLYEVKTESKIEDFVETIDNPFDSNPGNMSSLRLGKNTRLDKSKSIYKRKKAQIDAIKDEDIKSELLQGATLTSYFDV